MYSWQKTQLDTFEPPKDQMKRLTYDLYTLFHGFMVK